MKKFILSILIMLYVGATFGIPLRYEYCMGKLVDTNFLIEDYSMYGGNKDARMDSGCCSTDTDIVKLSFDQSSPNHFIANFTPAVITLLTDLFNSDILSRLEESVSVEYVTDSPPKPNSVPLFINHCTYLI